MNRGLEVHYESQIFFKGLYISEFSDCSLFQVDIGSAMAIERMCYARVSLPLLVYDFRNTCFNLA